MIDFEALKKDKNNDHNILYLLVAGSRSFKMDGSMILEKKSGGDLIVNNNDFIEHVIETAIKRKMPEDGTVIVVHDGSSGTSKVASTYAKKHGYSEKVFEPNWDLYGKSAAHKRNDYMTMHVGIREHKAAVVFWDGIDTDLSSLIIGLEDFAIPKLVYDFEKHRYFRSDEIKDYVWEAKPIYGK